MIRVIVVGLGLEGLIAAWVFRQHPHVDVLLVGTPPVGGDLNSFPPIVHTETLGVLLREVGVSYASYSPRDGMLLGGSVDRYPNILQTHLDRAQKILNDWQLKAGLRTTMLNGELRRTAPKRRLRCEPQELVDALTADVEVYADDGWKLSPGIVSIGGKVIEYDFAVITEPLWQVRSHLWFRMPVAQAAPRTVAVIQGAKTARFRRWDRVLTPYTPDNAVYEVADLGDRYEASISGPGSPGSLLSDLNWLFPDGYGLMSIRQEHGRLIPLPERVRWPENVSPLGAKAQWKEDVSLDAVLDGAYALLRRWFR